MSIGGLIDRPECRIEADLAKIRCVLADGNKTIGPFEIFALLAKSDSVPALLGLSGVLDAVDLHVSLRQDKTYLEFA
jgi:hypothetical protein